MSLLSRVRSRRSASGSGATEGPEAEASVGADAQGPVWTAEPPAWETVPAPAPLLPEMPLVASRDLGADLVSWRSAALSLEPLAHLVSADAPRGVVEVIAALKPEGNAGSAGTLGPDLELPVVAEQPAPDEGSVPGTAWDRPEPPGSPVSGGAGPAAAAPGPRDGQPAEGTGAGGARRAPVQALQARPAAGTSTGGPGGARGSRPASPPVELPLLRLVGRPAAVTPRVAEGPGSAEPGRPELPVLRPVVGERPSLTIDSAPGDAPPDAPGGYEASVPVGRAPTPAGTLEAAPPRPPRGDPAPTDAPVVRPAPQAAAPAPFQDAPRRSVPEQPFPDNSGQGPGALAPIRSGIGPGDAAPEGAGGFSPPQDMPTVPAASRDRPREASADARPAGSPEALEVALGLPPRPPAEAGPRPRRPDATARDAGAPGPKAAGAGRRAAAGAPVVRQRRAGLGAPLDAVPPTAEVPPPHHSVPVVADTQVTDGARDRHPGDMAVVAEPPTRPVTPAGPYTRTAPGQREADAPRPVGAGGSEPVRPAEGAAVRAQVGARLGMDLATVPVDRSPAGSHAAARMGARAFTTPLGVHVPQEAGSLDSGRGRAVLAHELVHVAQQARLGAALPPEHTPAGQTLEAEARNMERAFSAPPRPSRSEESQEPERAPLPLATRPPEAPPGPDRATIEALLAATRAAAAATGHGASLPSGATGLTPARTGGAHPGVAPASVPTTAPGAGPAAPPAAGTQRALLDQLDTLKSAGQSPPPAPPASDWSTKPPDAELTRLAQWLYPLIRYRLRGDLLADRDRAGVLTDLYRGW